VIDHQFGTTDVLIVMPVSAINAAISSTSASMLARCGLALQPPQRHGFNHVIGALF
jgi:hypothetical protein